MEHDLVAAAMRFFGDFGGKGRCGSTEMVSGNGSASSVIGRGAIVAQVVDDDGEVPVSFCLRVGPRADGRTRARGQRRDHVNRVGAAPSREKSKRNTPMFEDSATSSLWRRAISTRARLKSSTCARVGQRNVNIVRGAVDGGRSCLQNFLLRVNCRFAICGPRRAGRRRRFPR